MSDSCSLNQLWGGGQSDIDVLAPVCVPVDVSVGGSETDTELLFCQTGWMMVSLLDALYKSLIVM